MSRKALVRIFDAIFLLWWAVFLSIRLFYPKHYPAFAVLDAIIIPLFFVDNLAVFLTGAYEPEQEYRVYRAIRVALCVFPMVLGLLLDCLL